MKKQIALMVAFGCIGASAASVNYDLLGRKGSKMNSPMVYKNVDYSKMKADKQQKNGNNALAKMSSGLKSDALAIEGIFNNHGDISGYSGLNYYAVNVKFANTGHVYTSGHSDIFFGRWGVYPNLLMDNFIPLALNGYVGDDVVQGSYTCENYTNSTSYEKNECPSITRADTYGYSVSTRNIPLNNPVQASPYEYNKQITYKNFETVRDGAGYSHRSYIVDWLYENRPYTQLPYPTVNDWDHVGVYMVPDALPVKLNSYDDDVYYRRYSNIWSFSAQPREEMLASRAYRVLKQSSKYSRVYVGNTTPENPASRNPQIYMGLHFKKGINENTSETNQYTVAAKDLDNYIYTYRTTEIVAAGNFATTKYSNNPGTGYLAAEAHAENAITVGAVDASSKKMTSYTSYVTHMNGETKPEIYNYSNFYMNDQYRTYSNNGSSEGYNPYFDGAEMAAAYTAGMVSDLLATNPFYRWHPEAVKAALITSSHLNMNTPYPHSTSVTQMPSYKCLVTINQNKSGSSGTANAKYDENYCNHESRYWVGDAEKIFTRVNQSKKEIMFSVKRSANKHNIVAAIAWLSSGNDITNLGKIPQDFDLYAYENNTANVDNVNLSNWVARSTSAYNGYEKVSFNTNAEYVTFRIVFYSDSKNSENKGQVVLGFDVASY